MAKTYEQEQAYRAINRINDRLRQIGSRYGKDSYYYQNYQSKMATASALPLTSSGFMSRSNANIDQMNLSDLDMLERMETAGDIDIKIRENIAREEGVGADEVSKDQIKEYVKQVTEERQAIIDLGENLSDAVSQWRERHSNPRGKMTYKDFIEARDEFDKSKKITAEERVSASKAAAFDTGTPKPLDIGKASTFTAKV